MEIRGKIVNPSMLVLWRLGRIDCMRRMQNGCVPKSKSLAEPDSDAAYQSLKADIGYAVPGGLMADGVVVRQVGEETFRLCFEGVDEIILVGTDDNVPRLKTYLRIRDRFWNWRVPWRSLPKPI